MPVQHPSTPTGTGLGPAGRGAGRTPGAEGDWGTQIWRWDGAHLRPACEESQVARGVCRWVWGLWALLPLTKAPISAHLPVTPLNGAPVGGGAPCLCLSSFSTGLSSTCPGSTWMVSGGPRPSLPARLQPASPCLPLPPVCSGCWQGLALAGPGPGLTGRLTGVPFQGWATSLSRSLPALPSPGLLCPPSGSSSDFSELSLSQCRHSQDSLPDTDWAATDCLLWDPRPHWLGLIGTTLVGERGISEFPSLGLLPPWEWRAKGQGGGGVRRGGLGHAVHLYPASARGSKEQALDLPGQGGGIVLTL